MAGFSLHWLWKRRFLSLSVFRYSKIGFRNILSSAYACEEAWQKRLSSPILKEVKMKQHFVEVDKKFATKKLASGVDIDLFANCVQYETEAEQLEHLLYRFRRTKRCVEIHDSTHHAVVRILLEQKDYDTLFRILNDRPNYGIFPDFHCYNLMMDTFLKEKQYRDATEIAVMMMLQEDFSNPIACILGLYSCHMFLKECSWESWDRYPKTEEKEVEEDDDDEEVYVRVPYLRNPWFDDHFDIKNPKHLVGKTLYLIGHKADDTLGRTCQLIGLGLHEKWEKATMLLQKISCSENVPLLLEEGVSQFRNSVLAIPEDEEKTRENWTEKFEILFQSLQEKGKIGSSTLDSAFQKKLEEIPQLEEADISSLLQAFSEWEKSRAEALQKQNQELDCERRMKVIEEKKEYLYWKEKSLFFFENEEDILRESAEVEKIEAEYKSTLTEDEVYEPPIQLKVPPVRPRLKIKKFAM